MNSQKKYVKKSKQSKQAKKFIPTSKNDKYTVNENAFEDIVPLLDFFEKSGLLIKTAFGNLISGELTENDLGKHVAIFVDYENMDPFFHDKKFNKGTDQTAINNFDMAFKQSFEAYRHLIPKGAFVTGEIMIQSRSYTKSDGKIAIVLHGSIVASIPFEMINFSNLEKLCESYTMEGFVVVCTETSTRFKLKQCCFPQDDKFGKKMHTSELTENDFTKEGLMFCDSGKNEKFGYHVASLANVSENQVIATKQVNGFDTSLIVLTNETTIQNQLKNPFDGDKMINFYETIGEGPTYRYTPKCNFSGSNQNLVFQKKFDGESIVLHVDDSGKFHMLIRFNLDVFKVLCNDQTTKISFGWTKK